MAHSAQPAGPPHRTREIIIGVLALVVAIPVIVVVILALRHPDGRRALEAGSAGSTGSGTVSPTTAASGSTTTTSGSTNTSPAQSRTTTAPPVSTSSSPSIAPPPPPTSASTSAAAGRLPVIVLNNTAATGSTSLALSRLRAGGWTATDGGAFDGDILSTAAYYDPDADGSKAAALALQRQFPAIQRVVPAFAGLPNAPVVVVLTSDYH